MKLIILDRDGVINNDSDSYIKSADEWIPLPGSIEAIGQLSQAGYTIAIATNQSGLSRGLFGIDELEAMHSKMRRLVEESGGQIDGIFYCPHLPEDQCQCRKPRPGLFKAIAEGFSTSLSEVPVVGDSLSDLNAGLLFGCTPILVRTGKGLKSECLLRDNKGTALNNTPVYDNLASYVAHLLRPIK